MTVTATGINPAKLGDAMIDEGTVALVEDGTLEIPGGIVWLEVIRYGAVRSASIYVGGRSAANSAKADRVARVLAVGADCPDVVRAGDVAHYRRYQEFAGTDRESIRIDAELTHALRWRDETETREERQQASDRIDELGKRRPPRRAFTGTNFTTRDGRVLIAVPWQCITAVERED